MAEEIIKIHDARTHYIGSEEGREALLQDVRETVERLKNLHPTEEQKKEIYVSCDLKLANALASNSMNICSVYCRGNPYIESPRHSDYWIHSNARSWAEIWIQIDKQELDTFQKEVEIDLMEAIQTYEDRDFDGLVNLVLCRRSYKLEETLKALQGNKKIYLEVRAERMTIEQKKEENKKRYGD